MIFVGIDPGLTGALAMINGDEINLMDAPTAETLVGGKKRSTYLVGEMADIFAPPFKPVITHVYVERVHTWPGQGIVSQGTLMYGLGLWLGILAARRIPHTLVEPKRWTHALLRDLPKGDDRSVIRAAQLYPQIADQLRGPRGRLLHGRADALLIAHFGKTEYERGASVDLPGAP